MIEVQYEWKVNQDTRHQVGRDETGQLWWQQWRRYEGGEDYFPCGWNTYESHHGGIEAEELLRLVEQPSAVTLWDYLERNFPAVAAAAREAPAIAQAVRQAQVPEVVREIATELRRNADIASAYPNLEAARNFLRALTTDCRVFADRLTAALRGAPERFPSLRPDWPGALDTALRSGEQAGAEPYTYLDEQGKRHTLAEFQDRIRALLVELSGSNRIDGTGSDGDEIALTLAEIRQAWDIRGDAEEDAVLASAKALSGVWLQRVEEVRQEMAAWSGARPARVDELVVCLRRWAARLADPAPEPTPVEVTEDDPKGNLGAFYRQVDADARAESLAASLAEETPVKVDRSEAWWREKAEREGGTLVGAGTPDAEGLDRECGDLSPLPAGGTCFRPPEHQGFHENEGGLWGPEAGAPEPAATEAEEGELIGSDGLRNLIRRIARAEIAINNAIRYEDAKIRSHLATGGFGDSAALDRAEKAGE